MMPLPVWLPGPMFILKGLCPWSHVLSRGVSIQGSLLGGLCPGGLCPRVSVQGGLCRDTFPGIRKAGSMHPTRLLSCSDVKLISSIQECIPVGCVPPAH